MNVRPYSSRPRWLRAAGVVLPWLRRAAVTLPGACYMPEGSRPGELLLRPAWYAHEQKYSMQWLRHGAIVFVLLYVGWPLPIGLAWTRWLLEREAFAAELEYGATADDLAERSGGAAYGWMWPRAWRLAWFRGRANG